jgi:DNA-binding NtrC family response regulator
VEVSQVSIFRNPSTCFEQSLWLRRVSLFVINDFPCRLFGATHAYYVCMANRVLIIDDDDQLANAYREYLSERGYEVDCAQELEEAQTLLAYYSYSVVITDLRLNKLAFGGLDLIKHIHEHSVPTRVIVLTGYGWPELKAEASASGVEAFLRKPIRLKDLEATVGMLTGAQA